MRNFKTKYRGEASTVVIVVLATILVLGLITGLSSCTKVDSGCTGVRVQFGAVQETAFEAGLHFKTPFVEKVIEMNNKVQKVEVNAGSTSKDLQSVDSTLAVNYHLAKESSVSMYKNIGLSYEDTILQPAIQEATKSVMAAYRAEELIQRRGEVSIAIMDEIAKKVSDYGIIIDEFNITNFSFSQAFDDAIEQKLVAEQNKIKAATENEQRVAAAEADAAEAKARAEGEAESLKIKAEGEAEAIKAKADAEAEANKKIRESITSELIEYNKIEKWNGQQPNVVGGGSGAIIVDATK
jgi:regulator of protease activity HflC (stomatin/prohibitin superfamily)